MSYKKGQKLRKPLKHFQEGGEKERKIAKKNLG